MAGDLAPGYRLVTEVAGDGEFKRYLQGILNEYHELAYPLMEVPHRGAPRRLSGEL